MRFSLLLSQLSYVPYEKSFLQNSIFVSNCWNGSYILQYGKLLRRDIHYRLLTDLRENEGSFELNKRNKPRLLCYIRV
jgi:hypothetical protein